MMLKLQRIFLFILISSGLSACIKDNYDAKTQAKKDEAIINDFIQKNNISANRHSSGLYYQIIAEGNGSSVNTNQTVSVKYTGRLLNGQVFDKSEEAISFTLDRVIEGWTIGVPLIKVGGKIRLIVPSTLAYGNQSPGAGIPKNSVLDFTIDLINAK